MPKSIQVIQNLPVYGNTKSGLHIITSTLIESEKNVNQISALINGTKNLRPGLLDESVTDLQNCSSFDDGRKYYICVGSKAWVWDYEASPYGGDQDRLIWFYYTEINAGSWAYIDRETYYGDRTIGQIAKFQDNLNDFGVAIDAFWKSKAFDFGAPNWLKTILDMYFSTRSGSNTIITFKLEDDRNVKYKPVTIKAKSFSWDNVKFWGEFTWKVFRFQISKHIKVMSKNTVNFQVTVSNDQLNKNLSLMSLTLSYTADRKVR